MWYFGKIDESYGFDDNPLRMSEYKIISDEEHEDLIIRSTSENKQLSADENGNPILKNWDEPSEIELLNNEIENLEMYLANTDWYVIRNYDTGAEYPEDIKIKRDEARKRISEIRELLINN